MTIAHPKTSPAIENTMHRRVEAMSLRLVLRGGVLPVQVEYVDDGVVVIDKASGMFGEGSQLEAAAQDLKAHLKIALKDLKAHEDKLTPDLTKRLGRLTFYLG